MVFTSNVCLELPSVTSDLRTCLPLVLAKCCPRQAFTSCLPLLLGYAYLWSLQIIARGNHLLRVYLCSSNMLASGLCKVLSTANICVVFTFVPRESFTSCLSLFLGHVHLWSLLPTSQTIHCCQVSSATVTQECLKQPLPITTPPPPTTTTTTTSNASNTEDVVTCENYRRLSGERPLETADLHQFPICGFDAAVNQKETEAVRRRSTR